MPSVHAREQPFGLSWSPRPLRVNNHWRTIIKQRLLSFHQNDQFVGMDFKDPEVNFADLGKSMGVESERVSDPTNLRAALDRALANKSGPNLVEVICEGSV